MNINESDLRLILKLIEEKINDVDNDIENYYILNNHEGYLLPYEDNICTPYDDLQTQLYSLMDKIRKEIDENEKSN